MAVGRELLQMAGGVHALRSFPICRKAQLDSLLGTKDLGQGPSSVFTVRP